MAARRRQQAAREAEGRTPRPRKALAQHFLVDRRILGRIVEAAELSRDDMVLEVGPGRGVLTRELAERAGQVVAVELDEALAAHLREWFVNQQNVRIVTADAREVEVDSLVPPDRPYKLVANLPYYAASPIVRRFLTERHKPTLMVVMVQREVADNMVARPGDMTYLSVAVQLYGRARIVTTVPSRAFRPAPKVGSAVVRIDVYEKPALDVEDEDAFFKFLKAGFSSPRKQVRNCLQQGLALSRAQVDEVLAWAGVEPTRRPETISVEEWVRIFRAFRSSAGAPGA